jgi:hypothetical protein
MALAPMGTPSAAARRYLGHLFSAEDAATNLAMLPTDT